MTGLQVTRQRRIVPTHLDARPRKRSEAAKVSKGDLLWVARTCDARRTL